jgi:FkbM family methyltransferase
MAKHGQRAQAHLGNAWAAYQRGQLEGAAGYCRKAVADDPGSADAWHLWGVIAARGGQFAEAVGHLRKALQHGGKHPDVLANLASALDETGDARGAEDALLTALKLAPRHAPAFNNLGNLYVRQGRLREAIRAYDQALVIAPQHLNALKALAELLLHEKNYVGAAQLAQRATVVAPDDLAAWRLLCWAARGNRAWPGMLQAVDRALALAPGDVELLQLKFICLDQLKRYSEALDLLATLPEAVRRDPTILKAAADAYAASGRVDEALALLEALDLDARIAAQADSQYLFLLNYSERPAADIVAAHLAWGRAVLAAPAEAPSAPASDDPERPLRVGIVSGDLRTHSVAFFLEPLLRALDRKALSVTAYHSGRTQDATTARLKSLCAAWRDVAARTPQELAEIVRRDRIDILIELSGHTDDNRLATLALRPAPVQASYLGYPNTTGLAAIGYRLSDARADPPGDADPGCETVLHLPDCFHSYAGDESAPLPARDAAPARALTFGSFNNLPKISAATIVAWARILAAVPNSRLLLKTHALADAGVRRHLLERFARNGIGTDRVSLLATVPDQRAHLALYGEIDVALDTFPYNGTTTTCEALWMGVPVVSFAGARHAGRVGASLLKAIGHAELLGRDADDYVRLAVELAGDRERLAAYHRQLRADLLASPLADAPRFARHFEAALRAMWRRRCAAPDGGFRAFDFADALRVTIDTGVRVTVPRALDRITPWVLLEQESWFEDELAFVAAYLQPGMQVIDVGANYGLYALTAARRVGASGRVVAFEPTGATRGYLAASAADNGLGWLECRAEAVSDAPGEMILEIHDNPELNRLVDDVSQAANFERITVTTLDALYGDDAVLAPDFIKIDAEGFEAPVLRGAARLFARSEPLLMFEIKHGNAVHLELIAQAKSLGFDTWRLLPGPGVLVPTPADLNTLDGYTLNVFACKPARAARLAAAGLLVATPPPAAGDGGGAGDPLTAAIAAYRTATALAPARAMASAAEAADAGAATDRPAGAAAQPAAASEAAARVTALHTALAAARRAVEQAPQSPTRLATLARIAADLGERSLAVNALARALDVPPLAGAGDDARGLPPSPRFDAIAASAPLADWLPVAIAERYVELQAFSGYFDDGNRHLPLLERIAASPWCSPAMARRRQLLRIRAGLQPAPQRESLLAAARDDHRNPGLWCKLEPGFSRPGAGA